MDLIEAHHSRREESMISPNESGWFACWTRSRAEKRVQQWMTTRSIESFLPLVARERQWVDRKKRVQFPLFPGYLFVRLPRFRLHEAVGSPGVVTVVGMNGVPHLVRDEEIESVKALVEVVNRTGILPSPADFLEDGDLVRVVEGPFAGLVGILVMGAGKPRVVVQLDAIRQAVRIELERSVLRPAIQPKKE